jgi:two-component system sensor histidine kinase UhpB
MADHGRVDGFEFTYQHRSGELRYASMSAEVLEIAGDTCAHITGRDNTAARRDREALAESEDRFTKAFRSSPIGLSISRMSDGRIVEINTSFAAIVGHTRDEILGRTTAELGLIAADARDRSLALLRERGSLRDQEFEFTHKAGGQRNAIVSAERILLGGQPHYIASVLDITDRKRAENQLRASREELRQLADRVVQAREEESTRIARELHDELGQALTGILFDLSFLEERCLDADLVRDRQTMLSRIRAAARLAQSTIDEVRRIATELRPALLDDFGIMAAIEWQAEQFEQRSGVRCEVRANPSPQEPHGRVSTALFRIFQEALTNVARHARASKVSVSLEMSDGFARLTVEDDGRGISEGERTAMQSLGLTGMRERARLLGGDTQISAPIGGGTAVHVSIPYPVYDGTE